MPVIVYSSLDAAGRNIAKHLIGGFGFAEAGKVGRFRVWKKEGLLLAEVDTQLVLADYLDEFFKTDFFVFASKHKSEKGVPCLTVHPCGNFGNEAKVGGKPRELAFPFPAGMKVALQALAKEGIRGFDVTLECTHHGPTNLKTPLMFIEIGSSEAEWSNEKAGKAIAKAIMGACGGKSVGFASALGVGGPHYCPSFSKIELENGEVAFGHIIPNYAVDVVDGGMFEQALRKSGAERVVLDWKGLSGAQREKIISFSEKFGVKWVKDGELRKS